MEDDHSSLRCDSSHSWCPDAVILAGAGAKEEIIDEEEPNNSLPNNNDSPTNLEADIMQIFCLIDKPLSTPSHDCPALYLSPKIYPPTRDGWKIVSKAISFAFFDQGQTQLIKQRTPGKNDTNRKTSELKYTLSCRRWRTNYIKKNSSNDDIEKITLPDGSTATYKSNIRLDPMIGKNRGIRNPEITNAGKSLPRRTNTTKATDVGDTCGFVIHLYLLEGKHWRIVHRLESDKYHNHLRKEKKEMTINSNMLSQQERDVCSLSMTYAGSGAAQNIVGNMSGSSITKSQAKYVTESLEETKTTKGTSAANQTIEYLRAQSENKHIRYKALYHKVTSSSLLAMTKARQKRQRVEQRKKEVRKKP
jgi:hypothetical protein